jgi:hypothetical protein
MLHGSLVGKLRILNPNSKAMQRPMTHFSVIFCSLRTGSKGRTIVELWTRHGGHRGWNSSARISARHIWKIRAFNCLRGSIGSVSDLLCMGRCQIDLPLRRLTCAGDSHELAFPCAWK